MTTEITTILANIAATGATESSDPLRAYILGIEQQNFDLNTSNATLVGENNSLRQQLGDSQQNLAALRAVTVAARDAASAMLPAGQAFLDATASA